jgi:hypothetical protein
MFGNAFEAERARRIARNNQVMQGMGVLEAAEGLGALLQPKAKCTAVQRPHKPKVRQSSTCVYLQCMWWESE